MDLFFRTPESNALEPDEVDSIQANLEAGPAVDAGQIPMLQPTRPDSPELGLQRAILFDAVQCALRHRHSALPRQREEAASALAWIEDESDEYFLLFVPICQRLGLEPDWAFFGF